MSNTTVIADEEKEVCPICLEELPDQLNGKQLARFICCGKILCGNCATTTQSHLHNNGHELMDRLADGGELPPVFNEDLCPMCRSPHPRSDDEQLAMLMKHVEAGKPWALYQLADRYEDGIGVPVSFPKAKELHEKAAEQGYSASMWALGLVYMNGRLGCEVDFSESKRWLKKAIAKGNGGAMCSLAYHYFGTGKLREAKELLDQSVAKHFAYAEYLAATHYHQGVYGYPLNKPMAMELYKRAALQNSDLAQFNLAGTLYQDGNVPSALFWWRLCAKNEKSTQRAESLRVSSQIDKQLSSKCAACAKKKDPAAVAPLMRCAACQGPYYCNRNCQVFHWKMGHKVECKQVQELKKEVEEAYKQNYYFGEMQPSERCK